MTSDRRLRILALAVSATAALAFVPTIARSSDEPPAGAPTTPKTAAPKDKTPGEEWREELKKEMKEHPRLARSLMDLHETKEYLEKAPHDFGGHKASAIKSVDNAIKELHEALKYDAKHEEKPAGKN